MQLRDLVYHLIPGENPSSRAKGIYEAAYRCWSRVWSATFRELDGSPLLFSDDFTRQSQIGAIMSGDRCLAMALLHWVDFSLPTARADSCFKIWSEESIVALTQDGPSILAGTYLGVDPEFRGDLGGGMFLKDLVLGLVIKSLLESGADALAGTMRCNRGMDRSAYEHGATPIQKGVLHGVEVELVAFYRRKLSQPGIWVPDVRVESLWRGRNEIEGQHEKRWVHFRRSHGV